MGYPCCSFEHANDFSFGYFPNDIKLFIARMFRQSYRNSSGRQLLPTYPAVNVGTCPAVNQRPSCSTWTIRKHQ